MSVRKLCYFTLLNRRTAEARVRFGFSRRVDAQNEVSDENWQIISARLQHDGFDMIELEDRLSGDPTS